MQLEDRSQDNIRISDVIKRLPHNATVEQAAELTPASFAAALRGQARQVA